MANVVQQLVESDVASFVRDPVGRFVCTERTMQYCFSPDFMGHVISGRVQKDDVDLMQALLPTTRRFPRYDSIVDASRHVGMASDQLVRMLQGLGRYAKRSKGHLRTNVLVTPRRIDMRILINGLLRLVPLPYQQLSAATVEEALAQIGAAQSYAGEIRRLTKLLELDAPPHASPLTAREQQVADLVQDGLSDVAIANTLDVSESTIGSHLTNIYRKLGVHSRVELVRKRRG